MHLVGFITKKCLVVICICSIEILTGVKIEFVSFVLETFSLHHEGGDLLNDMSVLVFLLMCGILGKHWAEGGRWSFIAPCFLSSLHSDKNIGFQNAYLSNGQIHNLSLKSADERYSLKYEIQTASAYC